MWLKFSKYGTFASAYGGIQSTWKLQVMFQQKLDIIECGCMPAAHLVKDAAWIALSNTTTNNREHMNVLDSTVYLFPNGSEARHTAEEVATEFYREQNQIKQPRNAAPKDL